MAPTKSRLCGISALLLCVMIVGTFQPAEAGCGGFRGDCDRYDMMSSGILKTYCDRSNPDNYVFIDLGDYLSNHDGNLILGAHFAESCVDFRLSEDTADSLNLFATCKPTDQNAPGHVTAFNLNAHISYDSNNGLVWSNCRRRRSLLEGSTVEHTNKLPEEPVNVVVPIFTRRMTL